MDNSAKCGILSFLSGSKFSTNPLPTPFDIFLIILDNCLFLVWSTANIYLFFGFVSITLLIRLTKSFICIVGMVFLPFPIIGNFPGISSQLILK